MTTLEIVLITVLAVLWVMGTARMLLPVLPMVSAPALIIVLLLCLILWPLEDALRLRDHLE